MSRSRRGAMLGALALAMAVLVAACGNAAISLSPRAGEVSGCYRGLPTARAALHDDSAKLRGVHLVPLDHVLHLLPSVTVPGTSLAVKNTDTQVCTFAFVGHFAPGQVTGAPPSAEGPVAIVVVSSKDLHLLASYVGQALPHRFSRRLASPHLVVHLPPWRAATSPRAPALDAAA